MTAVHLQMDNMTALSYLVRMGGTNSKELTSIAKEIWDFLLKKQIKITAEYLPGVLNTQADISTIRANGCFSHKYFKKFVKCGAVQTWICLPRDFFTRFQPERGWRPDPYSQATDALQQKWSHLSPYAFPPFSLVGRVIAKVRAEKVTMVLITPAWQTQPWYSQLLQMSVQNPILLPIVSNLLVNPQGAIHPLVENGSLKLVAWKISGIIWQTKEYQRGLQDLSQMPEDRVHSLITNRPGESGLACVVDNKLIPLNAL